MKRLDVEDPGVFDKWREIYYDLSEEEQEQFGYDMEAKYPHQASFTASNFDYLFERVGPSNVLEVGGWKGELASQMLPKYQNIKSWTNIDYCKPATEKTVCKDSRYTVAYPDRFHWFKDIRSMPFEVCVAAHVIEHLENADLVHLLDYIHGIPTVMFEAPIGQFESNWKGYVGTHILTYGWQRINQFMAARGYEAFEINGHCYLYKLKGTTE